MRVDEVVIGEGVALDLRPARVPTRMIASAIDATIMIVTFAVLLAGVGLVGSDFDKALAAAVVVAALVGVAVGYPLMWETLTRGRSPGKYALGLRVVRTDGGPVLFRQALVRALSGLFVDFGVLSGGTGAIAVLCSLASPRGQRTGDLLAGTMVLRERVPRLAARDPIPPVAPVLAAWAAGADMSAVGDELAGSGRQVLARAGRMAPEPRAALADRLADEVAARVAPPPPPGVPAEAYLAAVLGERRRREIARLSAAVQRRPAPPHRVGLHASPPAAADPSGPTRRARFRGRLTM